MNISLSLKTIALIAFVAASTVAIVQSAPVASSVMATAHSSATLGI